MYKNLILLIIVFISSCASPNSESLCNGNPCTEAHRTVCEPNGDTYKCTCDQGYKDKFNICIKDIINENPCSPNPCKEENRTICNSSNKLPVCLCNENYHDESGICITNSKTIKCQNNPSIPKNSHEIINDIEIKYENNSWNSIPYCEIICNTGFIKNDNEECVNENEDPCANITCGENASCNIGNCLCDSGFHKELEENCVSNIKTITCNDLTPQNATKIDSQVEITYIEGAGWSIPANCDWSCNIGYHPNAENTACEIDILECLTNEHEENGVCISNIKQVNCNDNIPENSTKINSQVEITYNQSSGWTIPKDCEWICNNNFHKEGETCISNTRMIDCDDSSLPINSTKIVSKVEITYKEGVGWTIPRSCSWNCNSNYHENNNKCISNTKYVNCVDNVPQNATKINSQVEINYTEENAWSPPANCNWACNTGYHPNAENTACEIDILECLTNEHEENGVCISNIKQVNCNDVTPQNATKVDTIVNITYTSGNGWSTPTDCDWNCNTNYHQEESACIENGSIACDDEFEPNNTFDNAKLIVDANARDSQYTNLTICENDEDWYKINSEVNSGLEIDVNYTHIPLECDIDVKLYKMINGELTQVDSSVYSTGRETVYVRDTTIAETYYIKVYGFKSNCSVPYSLTANIFNNCIDDEESYSVSEQDDNFDEAKSFALNTTYNRVICDYDDDWYKYYFNEGDSIIITLDLINSNGDLDIFLYDSNKNQLKGTYGTNNQEIITYDIPTDGNYYIKVRGWWNDNQNSYSLKVNKPIIDFDIGDVNLDLVDDGCKVFTSDFSDQINSTTAIIKEVKLNKLLVTHDFLSDLNIYIAVGDENYSQIWTRTTEPSMTLDNNKDDDIENDADIDLINRLYDIFNGNSLGDKIFRLRICDDYVDDIGYLKNLHFSIKYTEAQ